LIDVVDVLIDCGSLLLLLLWLVPGAQEVSAFLTTCHSKGVVFASWSWTLDTVINKYCGA